MRRSPSPEQCQPDVLHGRQVAAMFGRIARWYDLLNHALSLGMDVYWRWRLARVARPGSGGVVLDLAAGTLDVSRALCRMYPAVRVAAVDFARPMLERGLPKLAGVFAIHPDDLLVLGDEPRLARRAAAIIVNQRGVDAGALEHFGEHVAVGVIPRHADHRHLFGRAAEEIRAQQRHGKAAAFHLQHRNIRHGRKVDVVLDNQHRNALCGTVGRIIVAVALGADDADEQKAGCRFPAVVNNIADLGFHAALYKRAGRAFGQLCQFHTVFPLKHKFRLPRPAMPLRQRRRGKMRRTPARKKLPRPMPRSRRRCRPQPRPPLRLRPHRRPRHPTHVGRPG